MAFEKLIAGTRKPKRLSYLAVALILLSPLAFMDLSYAAGRVFYDGFEDGTTNAWTKDAYRNKCSVATAALDGMVGPHNGKYMALCNWNGAVAWNDPNAYLTLQLPTFSYTQEFFIRTWVRYDRDVDRKNGGKAFRLDNGGSNAFFWGADMSQSTQPVTDYWEVIGGCTGCGPSVYWGGNEQMGNGQWHKIEIYMLAKTSGGAIKVWVDGKMINNYTGATTGSGLYWYPMYIMSNWSNNPGWEHDANNHAYWDDIEIYSDRGTGATGLMSDATITAGGGSVTPPATPTNLQVK